MICAAATLATLARYAAEDVFDWLTTDSTEPMRLEREPNMAHFHAHLTDDFGETTAPLPRYRAVLVAGLVPDAAGVGDVAGATDAREAAYRIGRIAGEMEASQRYNDDKLAVLHIPHWALDLRIHGGALADAVDALAADRDRLAAENAALRGAMPDAEMLQRAATNAAKLGALSDADVEALYVAAAHIRALSAPAPAAEAGTVGEATP